MTDSLMLSGGNFMSSYAEEDMMATEMILSDSNILDSIQPSLHSNHPAHRMQVAKNIVSIVRHLVSDLDPDAYADVYHRISDDFIPIFDILSTDHDRAVKEALLLELAPLSSFLRAICPVQCVPIVLDILVPFALTILFEPSMLDLHELAHTSLLDVAQSLVEKDFLTLLLPVLLHHPSLDSHLFNYTDSLDHQASRSLTLLLAMAHMIPTTIVHESILPIFLHASQTTSFRLRKSCAENVTLLAQRVSHDALKASLLPAFQKLVTDDVWGVRKACAEQIGSLAAAADPVSRRGILTELYLKLSVDISRWVRMACLHTIGPFISGFTQERSSPQESAPVPDAILIVFLRMLYIHDINNEYENRKKGRKSEDQPMVPSSNGMPSEMRSDQEYEQVCDMIHFRCEDPLLREDSAELYASCAFNFPAILLSMTASYWPHLRQGFYLLCTHAVWKVRRTMACCLFELSKLLPQEINDVDLLSPICTFLTDLEEIKLPVMEHIGELVSSLSGKRRQDAFPLIQQIIHESHSHWRHRELIALQLDKICVHLNGECHGEMIELMKSLITDKVAQVRKAILSKLPILVEQLESAELMAYMDELAYSEIFSLRQAYILYKLEEMDYKKGSAISEAILEKLSKDSVPNVRRLLAKLVKKSVHLVKYVETLKNDSDVDVQEILNDSDRIMVEIGV